MTEKKVPPKEEKDSGQSTNAGMDEEHQDNNKKAIERFNGAKRFMSLNELELALENVGDALSIETIDDDNYNRADVLFLATQICRRAKEHKMALDYIEDGIKCVNPYRADGPKFVLAKAVIYLQIAENETNNSRRRKELNKAIESLKMTISVSEVLINRRTKYRFEAKDVATIKRYHQIAIFDIAYAYDLAGYRREAIHSLDRLFELYPHFKLENTSFELYTKIWTEKSVLHIAT